MNEYRKKYYLEHKERFKEYYLKNRDALLERSKEWNKKIEIGKNTIKKIKIQL